MTDTTFSRRSVVAGMLATTTLAGLASTTSAQTRAAARAAGAAATPPTNPAVAQVRALYDRLFDRYITDNPEAATSLGLDVGEKAGLRSRISDNAMRHRFGFLATVQSEKSAIDAINVDALPAEEQTYFALIRWLQDRAAEIVQTPYGGMDYYPLPYVLTQLTGVYQSAPDFLESTHPVKTAQDAEAYIARLEKVAGAIDNDVEHARHDIGNGIIPPAYVLTKALAQTRALRGQSGRESGLATTLARKTSEAGIAGDWATRVARIVDGPMAAALDRQIALLEATIPQATIEAGVSRLPQGAEFYAKCLKYHTSTNLTPDEAHARGLAEVEAYQARIEPLLQSQGLTTGAVGARLTALGQRPEQLFANTDAGKAEILAFLNARSDAIRPLLPRYFNNPPAARVDIRRVPPAIEMGAPRGYAQSGSLDGTRPGAFYVNLRDTGMWPRFSLPTLVYHEALPGHVYQGAVLLATPAVPMINRVLGIAAYDEGWGLYAEQLADEMGVYTEEPLGRIGYLQAALYRAVRVVVDTGMHAKGWSRARALQYMIDITGLAPGAAENEIDRYIVWPGQATSYKLGHSEILRARTAAQQQMGDRFDIKGFHDVVLNSGSQPLEVLSRNVAAWSRAT